MRNIARILMFAFAFSVPWEFSFELNEPFGPAARIAGILLLAATVPAVLQAGRVRRPGPMQWAVLILFIAFCASCFWTIDKEATLERLRAYFQEMMIVWLVWELAESPRDLRMLLRAYVAGAWELAIITLANFVIPGAVAGGQIRFFAEGLDPNDTARFLDLAFPFAALLAGSESRLPGRILAWGYLPLGFFAVMLTASRGGFLAALLALGASAALLLRGNPRRAVASLIVVPAAAAIALAVTPTGTLARLATTWTEIQSGNLNERIDIWAQGWQAFVRAPFFGAGAGTFVGAAGMAPIDTAHNTALSIAVSDGLSALGLAVAVLALAVHAVIRLRGSLFIAMSASLAVWMVTTLTASVEENRTTWLLFALIALAGRLAMESPAELALAFPAPDRQPAPARLKEQPASFRQG